MELDREACYQALLTRDARFDGRFFTAVRTTGIYCRPICPAPTPKLKNCMFVTCAAAAQEAGFRPCMRCRPEAAPGTPAWSGTSASVSRALRLIDQGALDQGGTEALAGRLGLGARQLRRLFHRHLGASPAAVAQTRRLLLAKRMADETDLSFGEIALSAGFGSVRRFNDAFKRVIGRTPSESRARRRPTPSGRLIVRLSYRPPLPFETLLRYLKPRAIPGVEDVESGVYRRTVSVNGAVGRISVRQDDARNELVAEIHLSASATVAVIGARLRALFDLGADPAAIAAHLGADERLGAAVAAQPGLRVPGAWDPFELGVRAILGQQITVKAATRLSGRLAARFGEPLDIGDAGGPMTLFPTAERLAGMDVSSIGLPGRRARTISTFAAAVAADPSLLLPGASLEESVERLCALPGFGPWTAHYIALRALGEPDAFPSGDLGLRRAFGGEGGVADARDLEAAAQAWRPWRGYAALYLWTGNAIAKEKEDLRSC